MKSSKEVHHRLLYTRKEAAEILRISVSTLEVMIARGMLTVRRMGRKVLIPEAALTERSNKNVTRIWPRKVAGKTVRYVESDTATLRRSAAS